MVDRESQLSWTAFWSSHAHLERKLQTIVNSHVRVLWTEPGLLQEQPELLTVGAIIFPSPGLRIINNVSLKG